MDKLNLFTYDGNEIRTLQDEEGITWFAGIDVCNILGYGNSQRTIKQLLDEDERKLADLTGRGGQKRPTWTTSEAGLYSLILSSTKPEAKVFKRWITHEVLPAIRKAGRYSKSQVADKENNLKKLHHEIANLQMKRAEISAALKEKRSEFVELLYTDPDQLKIEFNQED
jgi:anti-repressor protein